MTADGILYAERQRPQPWAVAVLFAMVVLFFVPLVVSKYSLANTLRFVPIWVVFLAFTAGMTARIAVAPDVIRISFYGMRMRKIATADVLEVGVRAISGWSLGTKFGYGVFNVGGARQGVVIRTRKGDRVTFGSRDPEALAAAIAAAGGPILSS